MGNKTVSRPLSGPGQAIFDSYSMAAGLHFVKGNLEKIYGNTPIFQVNYKPVPLFQHVGYRLAKKPFGGVWPLHLREKAVCQIDFLSEQLGSMQASALRSRFLTLIIFVCFFILLHSDASSLASFMALI